jgi:long-chain acyl-CoA synthetase
MSARAGTAMASDATLSAMFWTRVAADAGRAAHLVKQGEVWTPLTWRQVGERVREVALGLLARGRGRGDAVALLCGSRAEWVQADFAILSAGCVTVPIYATYTSAQVASLVNDADARTLIVENRAQLAKALAVRRQMPRLQDIVVIDGGDEGEDPSVLTWARLRQIGRAREPELASRLAEYLASLQPDDVATIVYTSGTSGEPKGVVQTHGNHMATLAALSQIPGVQRGDVHLLFLPLAHSFARLEALLGVHRGLLTAFATSLETMRNDLLEVRPHFVFAVPRVFEKLHAAILAEVEASRWPERRAFAWAMRAGSEMSRRQRAREPVPWGLRLRHRLADHLVLTRLRQPLGDRLRFAVSGGAPLGQELAEFFHAAGLLILEGYGLTEACPVLTFNRIDRFKLGSVGPPIPGVELRIAADGEILARGPNIAHHGYLNRPEATAEAFGAEGWFKTGDIGRIDEDGFLHVTDRKKDLVVTSGGANIAPQHLENLLRSDPFISQALVYGDRRPYPTALIAVSPEELRRFARAQGILDGDYAQLVRHPEVVSRVAKIVETKNAEVQSYARVKRFALVPAEFTEATGEMTPTQKVKRKAVAARYATLLDSLYD